MRNYAVFVMINRKYIHNFTDGSSDKQLLNSIESENNSKNKDAFKIDSEQNRGLWR